MQQDTKIVILRISFEVSCYSEFGSCFQKLYVESVASCHLITFHIRDAVKDAHRIIAKSQFLHNSL